MMEWAERLDARILLHEGDREHVMRPSDRIELWSGERRNASDGVQLGRLGGHFEGATAAAWNGALLSGDIVQVVPDRGLGELHVELPEPVPAPRCGSRADAGGARDARVRPCLRRLVGPRDPEDGKASVLRSA